MFQIKYQCDCGKRILANSIHVHEHKPCLKCQKEIEIPSFGDPHFLLLLCSCGFELSDFLSQCPQCKEKIPDLLGENLKRFRPSIKMKIRCVCHKRLLVWAGHIGQEETCPKCHSSFTIPSLQSPQVLLFLCDCGNQLSLQEEICSQCQKPLKEASSSKSFQKKEIPLPSSPVESASSPLDHHRLPPEPPSLTEVQL